MADDISASWSTLLDQAGDTADTFFRRARRILEESELKYTASDVVALAAVMADDFKTSSMGVAAQRIDSALRDASHTNAEAVDSLARGVEQLAEALDK
jgi:hypothetical protein